LSQNKVTDSLEKILSANPPDSTRVKLYIQLSKACKENNTQKAFEYLNQAISLAHAKGFKRSEGLAHNAIGDLYWFAGDYSTTSDHYFKALKIFEDLHDKDGIAECYRNIGWIYQGQKNFTLTLNYYKKSLELNQELNNLKALVANYDDLSILYKMMKKYDLALEFSHRTILLADSIGNKKGVATGYGNLGGLYLEMGNYDLAIEALKKSTDLHINLDDHYNTAECYNALSSAYIKRRKPEEAIKCAEIALQIGRDYHYKTIVAEAYMELANGYAAAKRYEEANKNLEAFIMLQDSIYNENNSEQINEMSAKYESEKKELMINSLEKNKALSEEKLEQEKTFKIYLIIFCVLIAAFAFFLFRGNVAKKKANMELSKAYEEIEIKNKDISDSINYARQIQTARLPNPDRILHFLPQTFGLYKPKDVVSGDFYWFAEHENGKILLAAADCTGHGIPGAFMSMIGIDELNHASLEKRLSDPSEILSLVNVGVKKALRQNEENSMSRDGMDIALCIFDLKNNTLEYAGANRPLYYIRNSELIELAPTKAAIGGLTDNAQVFKSHRVELQKDDMIYIFTDGFADQFGGPQGKKFMTKRFKELLLSIHKKPIPEQEKELEQALLDWQENNSQVDDILVLGVRW
jgi:serine phosphatase RsbU (regulator of sigma subunit)